MIAKAIAAKIYAINMKLLIKTKSNLLFFKFSALNFLNAINIQNAGKRTNVKSARKTFESNSTATTKNKALRIAKTAVNCFN